MSSTRTSILSAISAALAEIDDVAAVYRGLVDVRKVDRQLRLWITPEADRSTNQGSNRKGKALTIAIYGLMKINRGDATEEFDQFDAAWSLVAPALEALADSADFKALAVNLVMAEDEAGERFVDVVGHENEIAAAISGWTIHYQRTRGSAS